VAVECYVFCEDDFAVMDVIVVGRYRVDLLMIGRHRYVG